MAQFVKIGEFYINLDLVRSVQPRLNDEGHVVRVTVIYNTGDRAELHDEAARDLVAAITSPAQQSTLQIIAKAFGKTPEEVAAMIQSYGNTPRSRQEQ